MALTAKKRAFAAAVLAGKSNNKDAAIAAGYSTATASAAGSRLVKDKDIAAYLAKCKKDKHPASKELEADAPGQTFDLGTALQHKDPKEEVKKIASRFAPAAPPKLVATGGKKV